MPQASSRYDDTTNLSDTVVHVTKAVDKGSFPEHGGAANDNKTPSTEEYSATRGKFSNSNSEATGDIEAES